VAQLSEHSDKVLASAKIREELTKRIDTLQAQELESSNLARQFSSECEQLRTVNDTINKELSCRTQEIEEIKVVHETSLNRLLDEGKCLNARVAQLSVCLTESEAENGQIKLLHTNAAETLNRVSSELQGKSQQVGIKFFFFTLTFMTLRR